MLRMCCLLKDGSKNVVCILIISCCEYDDQIGATFHVCPLNRKQVQEVEGEFLKCLFVFFYYLWTEKGWLFPFVRSLYAQIEDMAPAAYL